MPRKPFYEVRENTYIFPKQSQPNASRENPEEAVRQWCVFELLRAYGICISDIEFERPVRVGSKIYRIDILILLQGRPWALVECKEPDHAKHDDGMAQAVSYATAQEIQTEFAIYTNGTIWNVQRHFRGQWIPVPDLPIQPNDQGQESIRDLLCTIHDVAALLYKLDAPIHDDDAHIFMTAMQKFFHGWNSLTWGGNKELHFGTEVFLRVLSVGKDDEHYCFSKLQDARVHYERFREQAAFPFPIYPAEVPQTLSFGIRQLHSDLLRMTDGTKELAAYDAYVLRLSVAIFEYGLLWSTSKEPHPLVGANLHNALRDFLSYAFAVRLNISLPDVLDDISTGDMKSYCEFAWNKLKREL